MILLSPCREASTSPKLTKLNSSSESNSEQNDDSKDGFSVVKEPLATSWMAAESVSTPPKASLCSSSSVDKVGSGGQTVVVAITDDGENDPEVKSRRLTNSATGADEVCDFGDDTDREGDVQPENGLASA